MYFSNDFKTLFFYKITLKIVHTYTNILKNLFLLNSKTKTVFRITLFSSSMSKWWNIINDFMFCINGSCVNIHNLIVWC